jgi:hypothetical protein
MKIYKRYYSISVYNNKNNWWDKVNKKWISFESWDRKDRLSTGRVFKNKKKAFNVFDTMVLNGIDCEMLERIWFFGFYWESIYKSKEQDYFKQG